MTDLYNRSLPFSQDRYRQETEKRNQMLGAGRTPKKTKCVRCEICRPSLSSYLKKAFCCFVHEFNHNFFTQTVATRAESV